jgi:uncharacterized repeat protein (TIGR01451 family)
MGCLMLHVIEIGVRWAGWIRLFALCCALVLEALPGQASDVSSPDAIAPQPTLQMRMAGFTLAPEVDADGAPVLDGNGLPVILRLPLEDSVLTPGEVVLYAIALDNPTTDPAHEVTLTARVAPEVLLDPFSLTGPEGLIVVWADDENPEAFFPLFEWIDGEWVMQADLATLRRLRLTLPPLLPTESAQIEYAVTRR